MSDLRERLAKITIRTETGSKTHPDCQEAIEEITWLRNLFLSFEDDLIHMLNQCESLAHIARKAGEKVENNGQG